jgi:hypothetical protein
MGKTRMGQAQRVVAAQKASDPGSVARVSEWKPPKLGDIQAGFDKAIAATPRKREPLHTYRSTDPKSGRPSTRYTNVPGAQRGER